jgi:hypothetical protein
MEKLYTIKEASEIINLNKQKLKELAKSKLIESEVVDGVYYVTKEFIDSYAAFDKAEFAAVLYFGNVPYTMDGLIEWTNALYVESYRKTVEHIVSDFREFENMLYASEMQHMLGAKFMKPNAFESLVITNKKDRVFIYAKSHQHKFNQFHLNATIHSLSKKYGCKVEYINENDFSEALAASNQMKENTYSKVA